MKGIFRALSEMRKQKYCVPVPCSKRRKWGDPRAREMEKEGCRLIVGDYIGTELCQYASRSCKMLTVVRDPVSRLISSWKYCMDYHDQLCAREKLDAKKATLEQWAKHQRRYLQMQLLVDEKNLQGNKIPSCWFQQRQKLEHAAGLTNALPNQLSEVVQNGSRTQQQWIAASADLQPKAMEALHRFDAVGLLENFFPLSLDVFRCVTGAQFNSSQISDFLASKAERKSTGQAAKEHLAVKEFHAKWENKARNNPAVMKILEPDIQLYEEASKIFWGKVKECGLSPPSTP
uniref:Protein-tyrosine sulfotransferase n=1 Tax=Rhizochromulina marina TaxID=1034831 RepID=A0A6U0ZRY6_9STRA|mmetsp:Transcript_22445/g.65253  ORF Transcript_22445/g.65253 Transcript_22445/m.65253 type:complete len:289 (+) Transcript_22445:58-924(+)